MTEVENNLEQEWFTELDNLSTPIKTALIKSTLIPLMNLRRGRVSNLERSQIEEKLNRPAGSGKPGEVIEFGQAIHDNFSGDGIDPQIASEVADIAYYTFQLPEAGDSLEFVYLTSFLGIPPGTVMDFCLIKYGVRLNSPKDGDSKQKEYAALAQYLDRHPELKKLWKQPSGSTENENIYDHIFGEDN